jgi:hypothetical protein
MMKLRLCYRGRLIAALLSLCAIAVSLLLPPPAAGQGEFVVKPVVEKKITQLPDGPLYWRIENFATLAQAQSAAGPTSLAAEVDGKVWMFTLARQGGATPGGTKVVEIGPVPALSAPEYLLRISRAGGPPGSKAAVHSHPGSEAYYVLAGRLGIRTPHGAASADAGQPLNGFAPDTPLEVSSSGTSDLDQFVMFLVDATRPFSSPAKLG